MNSNFGNSQQLLEQNRKNDDSSSNFMPQLPTRYIFKKSTKIFLVNFIKITFIIIGNKKLEHDLDNSYLNQQRAINTSQSEFIASGLGTNSPKVKFLY
jgi:hypothetical protein